MMHLSKTFGFTEDRIGLYKILAYTAFKKLLVEGFEDDFGNLCTEILNYDSNLEQLPKLKLICQKIYCGWQKWEFKLVLNKYQEVTQNLTKKLSIREESRYVLLLIPLTVLISLNFPEKAIYKHLSESLWHERIKTLCERILQLCKINTIKTHNSTNSVPYLFESFISAAQIIFFASAVFIINYTNFNEINTKTKQILLFFASFYIGTVGDLLKFSDNENHRDFSIEFYTLATKIWPKYRNPYECIANWKLTKDKFQESFYFYACAFLSMNSAQRFLVYRQNLSVLSIIVAEKVKLWKEKLNEKTFVKFYDKNYFKNSDMYIFYKNGIPNAFFLKNDKTYILRDFQYVFYDLSINISLFENDLFNILLNLFVYDFLFINLKMVNKVDISELSYYIDKWRACFNFLRFSSNFFRYEYLNSFPIFAVILICTLENILNDNDSEINPILISSFIKIFLIFNDFVIYLLQKCNDDNLSLPLLKFLCLSIRCFAHALSFPAVRNAVFEIFIEENTFFFDNLYYFVKKQISTMMDVFEVPEFKVLGSSSFKISDTSEFWTKLNIFENKQDIQLYLNCILSTIKELSISENSFFRIIDQQFILDPFKFYCFNSSNKYTEFIEFYIKSQCACSIKTTLFLFDRINNVQKKKISLYLIKTICPDTNTFLVGRSCIMKNILFNSMEVLVSQYVLRELAGLRYLKKPKENIAERATEACKILISKIKSNSSARILISNGKVSEYNKKFKSYINMKKKEKESQEIIDDKILKDLLAFDKKTSKSIELGEIFI